MRDYIEEDELYRYLTEHCRERLNEVELEVARIFRAEAKAASSTAKMRYMLRKHWCRTDDPQVQSWLETGRGPFAVAVLNRLQRASAEFRVNRCGDCNRIVATPLAQQCLWCGNTWR